LHGVHDWVNHYGLYVSRICPVCHNYNPVRSSFMTNHRVCNKSNTMDAISGAGTAYPSWAPEFTNTRDELHLVRMRGWLPIKVGGPHLLSLLFLNMCLAVVAILNFRVLNYMGMYYLVFICFWWFCNAFIQQQNNTSKLNEK
jgi:hypothetical protein